MSARTKRRSKAARQRRAQRRHDAPQPRLAVVQADAAPVYPIRPIRPIPAPQTPAQGRPEPVLQPAVRYALLRAEVAAYAADAAMYAGCIRVTAPHSEWTGLSNGQALWSDAPPDLDPRLYATVRPLHLVYRRDDNGQPLLIAHRNCRGQRRHDQVVTAPYDLERVRAAADHCTKHRPAPPAGPRVLPLSEKPREHTHHDH